MTESIIRKPCEFCNGEGNFFEGDLHVDTCEECLGFGFYDEEVD